MPHSFPRISTQTTPLHWSITPNASGLEQLARGIWDGACQTGERPLVVLSTAGPVMGVRAALERYRPDASQLNAKTAFLPQVMSLSDWVEAAPGAWNFPREQSDLERWLTVYATLKRHPLLQSWFKAESEVGAWGLAQAIIQACDYLSSAVAPRIQYELNQAIYQQDGSAVQDWSTTLGALVSKAIEQAYPGLARKVVDQEAQVLLTFWRYISHAGDPVFRKHYAMAAYLEVVKQTVEQQCAPRPFIWVETADPTPTDAEIIRNFLGSYAKYAPVIQVGMHWESVALWAEACNHEVRPFDSEHTQADALSIRRNIQEAPSEHWHLLSAQRFEELAWAATKTLEQHLIDGKTKLALVAQDRLLARRVRALLARLGPALQIQDETGWKLSTTRAAAALNAWLELLRAPTEGPSARVLLEFLQNPFLDLSQCIHQPTEVCAGIVAELEDRFRASQARSGWETFHLAVEGGGSSSACAPNPLLLELLQWVRGRLNRWRGARINCALAQQYLHDDLVSMGMTQNLERDAAGKQLLEVLKGFDLGSNPLAQTAMRLGEWISLVKTMMENASYQEEGGKAKAILSILPLSSTRLREFDAVVMVGCDELQLPAFSEPPLFFSDTLSRLLQGSTIEAQFIQQARDLSQLLAACPSVNLLWQSKGKSGEPLRPSAWIARLQMDLPDWQPVLIDSLQREGKSSPLGMAIATLEADLPMPVSMSPSAYKALRDCPYRYYVRSLLGLRKLKGFEEGFDASLAGQTLHKVLRNFYHALKSQEQQPEFSMETHNEQRRLWMNRQLSAISESVFQRLIEGDARVLGVLRDWQKQIPSFIEWQLERERQGWRFYDAELKVGFELPFVDRYGIERLIRIEGYADRYDVNIEDINAAEVIDYKNQSLARVEARAESVLDDPQLLIYARAMNEGQKLAGRQVNHAQWVALKTDIKKEGDGATRSVAIEGLPQALIEFNEQIVGDIEMLWSGNPLKAFAPDGVCQYCEARGICRKGMW